MGFTLTSASKPTFNNTPQTVADLQAAADYASVVANRRVGSAAQRATFTTAAPAELREGLQWYETDTDVTYLRDTPTTWQPVASPWTTFTTTWAGVSGTPSIGNGTLIARYRYNGLKTIKIRIYLAFGSTTSGGTGTWSFTLPAGITTQAVGEQYLNAKVFSAGGHNLLGFGLLGASSNLIVPYAPLGPSTIPSGPVRNADASSAAGTGVPQIAGSFSFVNGSNFGIWGDLEIA